MFDSSSFVNPTPLAHADASRDVLPRGGTSQALLEKWDRIPQLVINSLIDSIIQSYPRVFGNGLWSHDEDESSHPSLNFLTTPTGGRLSLDIFNVHRLQWYKAQTQKSPLP
ncbi:hypothetical protein TNCV_4040901 [Trichonephila clavipes]|nr:hypothetical protein TNCV_4040901 [Trichonephila clavipes]